MADGGIIDGPSHQQGGIDAINSDGEVIAEIEGGERIFSVEDTGSMDKMAAMVNQGQGNEQLALELGYMVADAIKRQDNRTQVPTDDEFIVEGTDVPFDDGPIEFID